MKRGDFVDHQDDQQHKMVTHRAKIFLADLPGMPPNQGQELITSSCEYRLFFSLISAVS